MTTATRRRFGMHSNLLMHVIQRQAGTLAKAALEAVMNSIDAGCSKVDITLTYEQMVVQDDGHGFQTQQEIETYFETFGTPHEDGDAVYGQFRLGRGQLFCYGTNTWDSGPFKMTVDIKKDGLDYDLHQQEPVGGCRVQVDLYDPLTPSTFDATCREIARYVAWSHIPVTLNGDQISTDPCGEDWDKVTDDAYFRLRPNAGSVEVYNLGMYVESHSHHQFGVGGTIVSKRQLRVNMARNQVSSDCPSWKRMRQTMTDMGLGTTKKKKQRLTDAQKALLAMSFRERTLPRREIMQVKCFTDVRGRDHNYLALLSRLPVCVAPRGDRVGEHAHQAKAAFVLAEETLERFSCKTVEELMAFLAAHCYYEPHIHAFRRQATTTLSALKQLVGEDYRPIVEKKLTKLQRTQLHAIRKAAVLVYRAVLASKLIQLGELRTIQVGESEVAEAWTDGTTLIYVEKRNLQMLNRGMQGAAWLVRLLVHEYLHSESDAGSHTHDFEFLDAFHEICLDKNGGLERAAEAALTYYTGRLQEDGKRPTKKLLESLDHQVILNQAAQQAADLQSCEVQETAHTANKRERNA